MGYSMDLFLGQAEVDEEFICSICDEVMKDPTMIDGCQHIFCTVCIKTWMKSSATCPIDRIQIVGLGAPIRAYMNMYNRTKLHCGFVGCAHVSNLGEIGNHANDCAFNPEAVKLCANNCGASVKVKHAARHNCIEYLKDQTGLRNQENIELKQRFVALQGKVDFESEKCKHALIVKDMEIQKLKQDFLLVDNETQKWKQAFLLQDKEMEKLRQAHFQELSLKDQRIKQLEASIPIDRCENKFREVLNLKDKEIDRLKKENTDNRLYFEHQSSTSSCINARLTMPPGMQHFYMDVKDKECKLEAISRYCAQQGKRKALIVCNKQNNVNYLSNIIRGQVIYSMKENMSHKEKRVVLEMFRSSHLGRALIITAADLESTIIAALRQESILHTNYNLPNSPEDYIRRIAYVGSSGQREAIHRGVVINFVVNNYKSILQAIESF